MTKIIRRRTTNNSFDAVGDNDEENKAVEVPDGPLPDPNVNKQDPNQCKIKMFWCHFSTPPKTTKK